MKNNVETINNLFEDKDIRSIWDSENEEYYFSVVDVIAALTDSDYDKSRNYWKWLKGKLIDEGSELVSNTNQLKMKAQDGKMRLTDTLDTKGILRLIESVPSPKAEPFKLWLANLGKERIDEVFDPEIAVKRAIEYYHKKGYSDEWIKSRLMSTVDRNKLTDVWKKGGVEKSFDFAALTNIIYQEWSGMKANEYKDYKGIRKENLRDNMTDIELSLANLGEVATREIAKEYNPYGIDANKKVAAAGGRVAKVARDNLEETLGRTVISKKNSLGYKYVDGNKFVEEKNTDN